MKVASNEYAYDVDTNPTENMKYDTGTFTLAGGQGTALGLGGLISKNI